MAATPAPCELPEDELSHFIAERTEKMRVGDSTPININLRDGEVLRFCCTALPDGGPCRATRRSPTCPPYRRSRQRRLLPFAARRRRSQSGPAFARRGIGPRVAPGVSPAIDLLRRRLEADLSASASTTPPFPDTESNMPGDVSIRFVTRQDYPMASAVGRLQRVLRADGTDRARSRHHRDDMGALLRCL